MNFETKEKKVVQKWLIPYHKCYSKKEEKKHKENVYNKET